MTDFLFNFFFFLISFMAGLVCLLCIILAIKDNYLKNIYDLFIFVFILAASFICFFMSYLVWY